jgi:hypothetical protein
MKQEIYFCITSLPLETGGSVSNLALQCVLLLPTLCVCVCVCVCTVTLYDRSQLQCEVEGRRYRGVGWLFSVLIHIKLFESDSLYHRSVLSGCSGYPR